MNNLNGKLTNKRIGAANRNPKPNTALIGMRGDKALQFRIRQSTEPRNQLATNTLGRAQRTRLKKIRFNRPDLNRVPIPDLKKFLGKRKRFHQQ